MRYLDDGAVLIDIDQVENQIRPWALGRSNWLFAGSLRSGKRAAAIMSLIQSARMNGHDPYAYLKHVLTRLPTQRASEVSSLLPQVVLRCSLKNLVIRNALISDAAVLCNAERETAQTPGLLISRPSEFNCESFEKKIEALNREGLYLVAERNGLAVGHALLEPLGLEALAHVLSLTIVVHPNHVEQGVGHTLMTSLLDWARARPGLLKIELRVRETNYRARRLYEKFGFIEEGRLQKRILLPDGTFIADITMAWFASD